MVQSHSCVIITIINFITFSSVQKETSYSFISHPCSLIPPHLQPWGITNLLSDSMDLPILDMPYKWNHMIYNLLFLASYI